MYTLIAENQYCQQLELTHNPAYSVKSILGIDPPDAIINTTRNAGQDGSVYNSAYMDNRTITITLAINYPVEANRIQLYQYFKSKFPVILRYKNETRNVYIKGYVQSFQVAYFDKKETAQITVICPKPHFNGSDLVTENISNIVSMFEFPFCIEEVGIPISDLSVGHEQTMINLGDIDTGALIRITAMDEVVNPLIYNSTNNTVMKILDTLQESDVVEINSRSGEKSIRKISNGVVTNLINKLSDNSSWFTLVPGVNILSTMADSGSEYINIDFEIIYQYEGV